MRLKPEKWSSIDYLMHDRHLVPAATRILAWAWAWSKPIRDASKGVR